MPDTLHDSTIEWSTEASKDALSSIIKELWLSPEIWEMIKKLEDEDGLMCIRSLEKIIKETKEKNIGNADRDKKIKETLGSEYGIIITWAIWTANSITIDSWEALVGEIEKINKLEYIFI